MLEVDRIQQSIQKLPQPLQIEVLDFIEYLLLKVERETAQHDASDWSDLSLASAMRGMEDESVNYSSGDLKVVFP